MGDFMISNKPTIDKILHISYNNDGKRFEELLAEGIKQANLKAIQKRIITQATPETKESCK